MTEKAGRILGIDYGKRRIGVAISDPSCVVAQGLQTIGYKTPPEALTKIEEIVSTYDVSEIVVGLPLTLRGEAQTAVIKTNAFITELRKRLDIPILRWDERFTSSIAESAIRDMGKSPSKHKEKVDEMSAILILQSYLDRRGHSKSRYDSQNDE
ncbi:Holliday junction resolvase RuvX [candidate division KSB1 bacterium]|nr:Holliday junction resolvase RuvX [candidate division KSB1 bacterium]NIR72259.1 Holliday junction resolvase RuvX [candidate division KSB1 bacterium]NIS24230.1 Holliday junction resolvase RuvX [candidate division KSB1 bacterium]NIT71144.1 Holliday junction resolvase RuvX [candidate division KSB1 bacterium]NIU24849.1 Holliday junction resolvase RuvX [candidate division KSB1 bacterium]